MITPPSLKTFPGLWDVIRNIPLNFLELEQKKVAIIKNEQLKIAMKINFSTQINGY